MKTNVSWVLLAAVAFWGLGCPGSDGEGANVAPEGKQLMVSLVNSGAKAGAEVAYEVRVSDGPDGIKAFGLDIQYDPSLLSFTGEWERGGLTGEFSQVGVNEIEAGVVRIGGFTVGTPITAGSDGVLATLRFEVVSFAPPELSIRGVMDDLGGYKLTSH